jgi:hypothetical protein
MQRFFAAALAALFMVFACQVGNATRPSFVPIDANWRIDRHDDTPSSLSGRWDEVANNGNWGQGQCKAPGFGCHLNDWCTWWYVYAPNPPAGYTPVEWGSSSFPAGYNTSTGLYFY